MVDVSRATTGVYLPPEIAGEVWTKTQEASVVQRLARRISVPGQGLSIPMISGKATAHWVDEGAEKPISRPTVGNKNVTAYMMEVTVPFSNQFKRDDARLFGAIVQELPLALGTLFDETVFGYHDAPGSNFDTLAGINTLPITTTGAYDDYLTAMEDVNTANGAAVTAWVASYGAQIRALRSVNALGQPLLQGGAIQGIPVVLSKAVANAGDSGATPPVPATIGIGGDWADSAVWGQVESIQYAETTDATLPDPSVTGGLLHLFSRNMFAVRFEVEMAFRVTDKADFLRLTPGS